MLKDILDIICQEEGLNLEQKAEVFEQVLEEFFEVEVKVENVNITMVTQRVKEIASHLR